MGLRMRNGSIVQTADVVVAGSVGYPRKGQFGYETRALKDWE